MPELEQLRTDIAEYVQRVLMTEAWEETGEEVADRVMSMVKAAGWGPKRTTPRVFFPGDTVPAGQWIWVLNPDGRVGAAMGVEEWTPGHSPLVAMDAPSPEEFQATVDRAKAARADSEWQHTEGVNP